MLAFSDNEIVKMAIEDYVPVAADDWYQRRRKDDEGKFFMSVSDQSPQKANGAGTRQGIYMLTAGGKLLAFRNAGQRPDIMRDVLREGLAEWKKLPEAERKPGALTIPEHGPVDRNFTKVPPPNALILNVFCRTLDKASDGKYADAKVKIAGAAIEGQRDHAWLTEAEWRGLVPARPEKGASAPLPPALSERLCRFHLLDGARGEPPAWTKEHIRAADFKVTVDETEPLRLRIDGKALLATDADVAKAERGYDVALLGYIDYDVTEKKITRFDMAAVGEHWGEGQFTKNARAGRTPLGVAFELCTTRNGADVVPPQGIKSWEYGIR